MTQFHTFSRWVTAAAITIMTVAAAGSDHVLVVDSSVPTPEVSQVIIMPVHCDSSGNVYLRPPLSKIGRDGRRTATFDLSAAGSDGLTGLMTKAFSVDPDGTVYELTRTKDDRVAVVRFDKDGHYLGSTVLDQQFEPQQLGVFQGDVYLVSGVTLPAAGSNPEFTPYLGLFDRAGRLIKQVGTGEPTYLPKTGSKTGPKTGNAGKGATEHLTAPPELGLMESDGTQVYLLRQGKTPTIFVISNIGDIDRKLTLAPPSPDAQISALRVGVDQFLVEYVRPNTPNGNAAYNLVLYSLQGDKLEEYTRGPGVSGTLGCTDWNGDFSFLTADDHGPVLLRATMR